MWYKNDWNEKATARQWSEEENAENAEPHFW